MEDGHGLPAPGGLWRLREWLAIPRGVEPVTLGEGGTPLVVAARLEPAGTLLLKNEAANPTLSFKDRGISVATTMARERGARGLIAASTGNTAVSVAAYGARAGLPAACIVPARTPTEKLRLVSAAGASLLRVDGSYSDAHALARAIAAASGWVNLTTTYLNPDILEGNTTVGLEIYEQLGRRAPDAVVVPVGAGPLLSGIAMAFDALRDRELLAGPPPRLVAIQAAGCAPIARAFAEKAPVRPWTDRPVQTRAGSIADPLDGYHEDGERTLAAIRATGGAAVAVGDEAIAQAAQDLARKEGLVVELGAAAALAGYRKMVEEGELAPADRTVLVLTGHGSKEDRAGEAPAAPDLGTVAPGAVDDALRMLEAAA